MFYDNFTRACRAKGTTITTVLKAIGKSSGNTGNWSAGGFPRLDIVMEMAKYLDISLDELVYGHISSLNNLSDSEKEWLDIISRIPEDKQMLCKDILLSHLVAPENYDKKK